jgi:lysophospholipase L1-like esterase
MRGISTAKPGSIVLLGDSHLHGLVASSIAPNVVNLSIGGLTLSRLAQYLETKELKLPAAPRCIFALIGHNDFNEGSDAKTFEKALIKLISALYKAIPSDTRLIFLELWSTSNVDTHRERKEFVDLTNQYLRRTCAQAVNSCTVLKTDFLKDQDGNISKEFAESDGVHLDVKGYGVLSTTLASEANKAACFRN